MNRIAAIRTGRQVPPLAPDREHRCSFVEDLNWPAANPGTPTKPPRPTEVWVPGRYGQWQDGVPTIQ